jgi:hypothetical protein
VSRRWEALVLGLVLLLAAGAAATLLSGVVQSRIETWLNPWDDPLASSYQTLQGLLAMATGGLAGTGPGWGAPGLIPAVHTDYIIAAIVEEWGLAGGVGLLGLFAVLTSRGLRAATRGNDAYAAILGAGLSIAIGLQAVLIIGGVVRALPLTGIPLPLVSYGGSSLLTTAVALALLIRISANPGDKPRFVQPIRHIHTAGLMAWAALALALGWWAVVRGPELRARPENPRTLGLGQAPSHAIWPTRIHDPSALGALQRAGTSVQVRLTRVRWATDASPTLIPGDDRRHVFAPSPWGP